MHDTLTIFSLLTTIGVCFLSCLYTLVHVGFIADQTAPSEAVLSEFILFAVECIQYTQQIIKQTTISGQKY